MRKLLALGLLMALLIGTASAALFESGTKDAQPTVLYGKYNNTIVPIKAAADGSIGAQGEDSSVIFNVKTEYGAKGDGIELVDGNITATDKTFTSATASFTSDDVGKVITIFGAGGTNIDLTSTISSVTDANTVEIADAATVTQSNIVFRYGTDDTTAIRNAIDAVYNAGNGPLYGEVFFPRGIYIVNGAFDQYNNTQISFPYVTSTEPYVSITLRGVAPPHMNDRTSQGSVIFGTRYGTDGGYAMLGGGNLQNSRVRVHLENLTIKTVQDPTHTMISLSLMNQASGKNIKIDTSYYIGYTVVAPTHTDSYGLKLPIAGNGNTPMLWQSIRIMRFYNGIYLTEHSTLMDSEVVYAINALNFSPSSYVIDVGYVSVEYCVNVINMTTGATKFSIRNMDIEQRGSGDFTIQYTINDPSNYGSGIVYYSIVGLDGGSPSAIVNGAKNISLVSQGANSAWSSTFKSNQAVGYSFYGTGTSGTTGGQSLVIGQDSSTAVSATHRLGQVAFAGARNSTHSTNIGASLEAYANENFATNDGGTYLVLKTTPDDSVTRTEKIRILGNGNIGIGNTAPNGMLVVDAPAAQTIAAGNTITDSACGTLKLITAAGAVTTDTTNTFTAPAAGNEGCIMYVCNTGANNITLDNNANFKSAAAGDVVMTQDDCVTVGSTGASGVWYQLTPLQAN